MLTDLINLGIKIIDQKIVLGKLSGKTFLFTGSMDLSRDQLKENVRQAGGKIVSSVSNKLDYLVVGDKPGSKLKKAQALKLKILTEDKFKKLLI